MSVHYIGVLGLKSVIQSKYSGALLIHTPPDNPANPESVFNQMIFHVQAISYDLKHFLFCIFFPIHFCLSL